MPVVAPADGELSEGEAYTAHTADEVLINSGAFTGMRADEGYAAIVDLPRGARARQADDHLPAARLADLAPALLGLPDPDHLVPGLRPRARAG